MKTELHLVAPKPSEIKYLLPALYCWTSDITKDKSYYLITKDLGHLVEGFEIKDGKLGKISPTLFALGMPNWTRLEAGSSIKLIQE
jgi:hypothetical protein